MSSREPVPLRKIQKPDELHSLQIANFNKTKNETSELLNDKEKPQAIKKVKKAKSKKNGDLEANEEENQPAGVVKKAKKSTRVKQTTDQQPENL